MRRGNFLIVFLVTIATYIALSAFVGRRPWGWQRRWYYGRNNYHRCDDSSSRYYHRDNRGMNPGRQPLNDSIH